MTTFTDITHLSARLTATGQAKLAAAVRARIAGGGAVRASASVVRGGVVYREIDARLTSSAAVTAGMQKIRPIAARLVSRSALRQGDGIKGALPALAMQVSNRPYGGATVALPALQASSHDYIPVPQYSEVTINLPPPVSLAYGLAGEIGSADENLPAMLALSSDRPYAAVSVTFAPMIALSDSGPGPGIGAAYDTLIAADAMEVEQQVSANMMERATISDEFSWLALFLAEMDETATISDIYEVAGVYAGHINSAVRMVAGFAQDGTPIAWVVNTNTRDFRGNSLYPNSMYDEFDFNSLGKFKGRYFGARSDGIYELIGDTDAGEPIVATVQLSKDNYGSSSVKHVRYVYADVDAAGDLAVTVEIDNGASYTYKMPATHALKNSRAVFGRGLRAQHWQLTLRNEDGRDFTIDTAEVFSEETGRRLK